MWNDLRFAFRTLRRSPAFSAIAVLSLALGIGANTAIFSLLYQVVLRSVPVHDPESLVYLQSDDFNHGWTRRDNNKTVYSYPMYRELRDRGPAFSGLIARASFPATLSYRGDAVRATAETMPFSAAAECDTALSKASGPSTSPPEIWPRSAILHSAAASIVDGIFDVTVSTAERIATRGVPRMTSTHRSIAF